MRLNAVGQLRLTGEVTSANDEGEAVVTGPQTKVNTVTAAACQATHVREHVALAGALCGDEHAVR